MCQTDKCVVAQVLKVVLIINLIIIDHSRMIQSFKLIEIGKYDDGGQLMSIAKLCIEAVHGQSRNISKQYFTNRKVGLRSNASAFHVHGLASLILKSKYVRSRNFFGVS